MANTHDTLFTTVLQLCNVCKRIYSNIIYHNNAYKILLLDICISMIHIHIIRSQNHCVRGALWSVANQLHGQRTRAFSLRPGKPNNSCSTLPRAVHLEGGVIGYHLALEMCSGTSQHATNHSVFVSHTYHPPPLSLPSPNFQSHDRLHTRTNCDYLVRLPPAAQALLKSSLGVCGNSATTLKCCGKIHNAPVTLVFALILRFCQ